MLKERWEGDTSFFLTIIFSNNKTTYMETKKKNPVKSHNR